MVYSAIFFENIRSQDPKFWTFFTFIVEMKVHAERNRMVFVKIGRLVLRYQGGANRSPPPTS